MNSETAYDAIRARLALLIGGEPPFAWANAKGIASATFNRFWNERKMLKRSTFEKIALAAGVRSEWLLTGQEPMQAPIGQPTLSPRPVLGFEEPSQAPFRHGDLAEELDAALTDAVVRVHEDMGVSLSPSSLGRTLHRWRRRIEEASDDLNDRLLFLKLVKVLMKEDLLEEAKAPGSGKASGSAS